MYELFYTSRFKKDLKRFRNDFPLSGEFLNLLQEKGRIGLLVKMKVYTLKGEYKDNWECHLKPDLLMIWIQVEEPEKITLVRIGSHAELI
jgi:mRNA interferase YafQ